MYRWLFYGFTFFSVLGAVLCWRNAWKAGYQWLVQRPSDGLGKLVAYGTYVQQMGWALLALGLLALSVAVLALSDPGNKPRGAVGWILYGVLWGGLLLCVGESMFQAYLDRRIRTYPLDQP